MKIISVADLIVNIAILIKVDSVSSCSFIRPLQIAIVAFIHKTCPLALEHKAWDIFINGKIVHCARPVAAIALELHHDRAHRFMTGNTVINHNDI